MRSLRRAEGTPVIVCKPKTIQFGKGAILMPKSLRIASWSAAIAVLLMLNGASLAYAQGTWTSLAPVPSATEGMAVGGVGQVIIAAYGLSGSDTNQTRLYNISTNSWSLGATAPGSASSEQAYGETTHDGFFYVIGGRANGPGAMPLNDLRRYDPVSNTWTTLAPMPTARAGAAAVVVEDDDAILVIGGRTATAGPCSGGGLSVVERYDIETNTWSTVAPLPGPARSDLAAVSHDDRIFVFGGCSVSGVTGEVDSYDPETDTWTTGLAAMPTPRASLVAGKVGNKVFAIGGTTNGLDQVNTNEAYNISTNTWSTTPAPMITARSEAGVYSHKGRIFVVGGGNRGISTAANEVFKSKPKAHEPEDEKPENEKPENEKRESD